MFLRGVTVRVASWVPGNVAQYKKPATPDSARRVVLVFAWWPGRLWFSCQAGRLDLSGSAWPIDPCQQWRSGNRGHVVDRTLRTDATSWLSMDVTPVIDATSCCS